MLAGIKDVEDTDLAEDINGVAQAGKAFELYAREAGRVTHGAEPVALVDRPVDLLGVMLADLWYWSLLQDDVDFEEALEIARQDHASYFG